MIALFEEYGPDPEWADLIEEAGLGRIELVSAIFDWARPDNLQPAPITVEIWRELPEEFCRQVEVLNGQAVRCEAPSRAHQSAVRRLANVLETAARREVERHPGTCLDVNTDFDVALWEVPTTTIRRPDVALFDCAPEDLSPLPASLIRIVVEVVSPTSEKTDRVEKMGEYAQAGIPWYWLVWLSDNRVESIDIYVLDHTVSSYRLFKTLYAEEASSVEMPIRIGIDWSALTELTL